MFCNKLMQNYEIFMVAEKDFDEFFFSKLKIFTNFVKYFVSNKMCQIIFYEVFFFFFFPIQLHEILLPC